MIACFDPNSTAISNRAPQNIDVLDLGKKTSGMSIAGLGMGTRIFEIQDDEEFFTNCGLISFKFTSNDRSVWQETPAAGECPLSGCRLQIVNFGVTDYLDISYWLFAKNFK